MADINFRVDAIRTGEEIIGMMCADSVAGAAKAFLAEYPDAQIENVVKLNDPTVTIVDMASCCCEAFGRLINANQVEQNREGTWDIFGCCGGGCFVVVDMTYCPYCGVHIAQHPVSPHLPETMS